MVIGTINVKAGDIEVHCGARETQPSDDVLGHQLIERADIRLKEGIEATAEHIIIEVVSTDHGANQVLYRLVGKELRENMQGAAVKTEAIQYHGDEVIAA